MQIKASTGTLSQTYRLTVYPDPGAPGLRLIAGALGSSGNLDGDAEQARFSDIQDIEADANNNLYLMDNGKLRKVDASGKVDTLAPTGILDISVSPDNIVYLLASRNGKLVVLKLLEDGSTSVHLTPGQTDQNATAMVAAGAGKLYLLGHGYVAAAGGGSTGNIIAGSRFDVQPCADGSGAAAHLGAVADAGLDAAGNLLLLACSSLRQITPGGAVTTLAGELRANPAEPPVDGNGPAARFGGMPYASLTSDASGNIRVLDLATDPAGGTAAPIGYRLRAVSRAGAVRTLAQGERPNYQANAYGAYGRPTLLRAVRYLPNGKLIVASLAQLWQADTQGALTRYAGNEGDIVADNTASLATARFVNPRAVGADPAGNLYLLAQDDSRQINGYKIAADGGISRFMQTGGVGQPVQLLAAPEGGFYMVTRKYPELGGHDPGTYTQIYKLSTAGVPQLLAGLSLIHI